MLIRFIAFLISLIGHILLFFLLLLLMNKVELEEIAQAIQTGDLTPIWENILPDSQVATPNHSGKIVSTTQQMYLFKLVDEEELARQKAIDEARRQQLAEEEKRRKLEQERQKLEQIRLAEEEKRRQQLEEIGRAHV